MAELSVQERLQPSLLDRLLDDAPSQSVEGVEKRVMTKEALRSAVLRDLVWLFNATNLGEELEQASHPHVYRSVVNFGLPSFGGEYASQAHRLGVEEGIREAILRFEPRVLADTLEVELILESAAIDAHNRVGFIVRGMLWAQPVPIEIYLRSRLDLEEGRIEVESLN